MEMLYEGLSQADEPRVSAGAAAPDSDPKKAFSSTPDTQRQKPPGKYPGLSIPDTARAA
jgi:hypothetical protein